MSEELSGKPKMATHEIRRLTKRDELEAAFRLRYRVIAEERGGYASPESVATRMIEDEADAIALSSVFGAFSRDGELVGTNRAMLLSDGMPKAYAELFAGSDIDVLDPEHTTVNSRFIFREDYRTSRLPMALIGHVYRIGTEMGVRRDYIFVETHLEPLYLRLGYTVASECELIYPGSDATVRALTLDFTAPTKFRAVSVAMARGK